MAAMNRNAALFVVMCLVWGLTWWPVKVGAAHVPPIFLAAARFLLAGVLMLAWAGRGARDVPKSAHARLVAGVHEQGRREEIALGTLLYCTGAVLSRPIATTMPVVTLAGWQTLIGGVGLSAVSLALEPLEARHLRQLASWPTLPALLVLVAAGSLAGFTIYMKLLRDWGAFRAGLYAFVSPVVAVAVGVVALGERFGWAEGAGAVLMFAAAAIAVRRKR